MQAARHVFGAQFARRVAILFWPLFLLNQFALQSFSILDIDTSIYGPLLLAVVFLTVRVVWRDGELRETSVRSVEWATLIFVLILCLWAKLTTVLMMPFVIAAVLLVRFG